MRVVCPYCDRPAELVTGAKIYAHRPDLAHRWFWRCAPCEAWTGTHADSKDRVPLGRLANAALRRARQRAHAAFDPLWKSGGMRRREAYQWLASALGIAFENCHIGMFDVDACEAVVAAVRARRASGATVPSVSP